MKTDTEAAMVELDNIMRANELTMAVTAALPAMAVAAGLLWALWRALSPPPPNMRTTAGPVRVAMAELEQARRCTAKPLFDTMRMMPGQGIGSLQRR